MCLTEWTPSPITFIIDVLNGLSEWLFLQVDFRALDVSFFRFVLVVWVSKWQSKPTNTNSAGYKFFQMSAGFKGFSFSQGWRMWGVGVSQRAGDGKWEKCGRKTEWEWEMEREIDIEMQGRPWERERSWEKMWFGLGVLGCMLHLPSLTERESDGHWQELNQ